MKDFLLHVTQITVISYLFLGGIVVFYSSQNAPKPAIASPSGPEKAPTKVTMATKTPSSTPAQSPSPVPTPAPSLMSQLGSHSQKGDCWIAYRGHVYDVTSYFGSHPGGDAAMAKYCGQDATTGFDTKDQNPPNPHSAAVAELLQNFLIE